MQSKSPFKKVDIFDGRASSYRNPSTVIQPIVGAIVGKQIAKTASELGTKAITTSMNKDQRAAEAAAGDLKHQRAMEIKWGKGNTGPAKKPATHAENMAKYNLKSYKDTKVDEFMDTDYSTQKKEGGGTNNSNSGNNPKLGDNFYHLFKAQQAEASGIQDRKKGSVKPNFQFEDSQGNSPFYHNESAVGSIAGAQPQSQSAMSIAGSMLGGKSMAEIKAIGQKPTDSAQGGGGVFGAAAQAAGGLMDKYGLRGKEATQESLPPPNQVAESGSYAGTGERMLEMDSNPVGNQSIGRDTDVASQLFGSGQRASMLAMKGTPLHNAGHGENKAHLHSSNKTTKFENNVKTLISDYSSEHDNVPEKPKKYINPFTASVNSKKQTQ